MKTFSKLPDAFRPTADTIISRIDGKIDYNTAGLLLDAHRFASYSFLNFLIKFWWDDHLYCWCSEVWNGNKYVISHAAEFLNDLVGELRSTHRLPDFA